MSRAQILNREQECRDQQLGVEPGLSEQDFLLSASAIALSASSETAWLAIEARNDRQGTRRPSSHRAVVEPPSDLRVELGFSDEADMIDLEKVSDRTMNSELRKRVMMPSTSS